jgi:hypothetical protein
MILGLVVLSSRPRFASGLMLTVGGATALHFLGVIVAAWRAIGDLGNVGSAGFVGIAGGLLVAAAGFDAYRSTKPRSAGAAIADPA